MKGTGEKSQLNTKFEESRVVICDEKLLEYLRQKGFGEIEEGCAHLLPEEAAYLAEIGKLDIDLTRVLAHYASRDPRIVSKYFVYRDLRSRGYVVRAGTPPFEYRVYEKGKFRKDKPAKYVIKILAEGELVDPKELYELAKHAIKLKKHLIIAIVDANGFVTYYAVDSIEPLPPRKQQQPL